ncbi:MAG: SPOR domain-containing protein [Candidatus Cloacimonadales bacterium]|nr:SPOR domain-containing protein [Candidatus Cloacimonadales bacterium]
MRFRIVALAFLILIPLLYGSNPELEQKYKQAKQTLNQKDFLKQFEELSSQHKDDYYGQLALLELAKSHLLDRSYKEAISCLEKIYIPEIEEKQYWLAKAYLNEDKYQLAIISAQLYISETKNLDNAEVAYFIVAESFLQQHKYKQALDTLESLRVSKYIKNNIPYLYFKMGNCSELLGKYIDALVYYKKLKQEFPYNQYSYLAEERIYKLKNDDMIDVDLTTFNSHRSQEPKTETKEATGEDLKIYLQVGAFSSEDNAVNLGKKVKTAGYKYTIFPKMQNETKLYIVAAGPFENEAKLKKALKVLDDNGIKSFMIKRYD